MVAAEVGEEVEMKRLAIALFVLGLSLSVFGFIGRPGVRIHS
jgi:hypothetical protein